MRKQEGRETVAGPVDAADQGGSHLPWSGLSLREARDFVGHGQEPVLPHIAAPLMAGIEADRRSPVDAGEPYPAIDHALLYAYELKGRRLQAQAAGEYLIGLGGSIGKLLRWALLNPLKRWNERAQRIQELGRLDDRMLRDIGLTRPDIAYVARYGIHPGQRIA